MNAIKQLLASAKARAVAVSFEHGAYGGILAYAAATQVDTTLLAHVAWWKGVLVAGSLAGVGNVVGTFVKPLVPLWKRVNAPKPPAA